MRAADMRRRVFALRHVFTRVLASPLRHAS
jgi:hypothetical protein